MLKRVFTKEEHRDCYEEINKSLAVYPDVSIVDEDGKTVMVITTGSPDTTCNVCSRLPENCYGNDVCSTSWMIRALKAEKALRNIKEQFSKILDEG